MKLKTKKSKKSDEEENVKTDGEKLTNTNQESKNPDRSESPVRDTSSKSKQKQSSKSESKGKRKSKHENSKSSDGSPTLRETRRSSTKDEARKSVKKKKKKRSKLEVGNVSEQQEEGRKSLENKLVDSDAEENRANKSKSRKSRSRSRKTSADYEGNEEGTRLRYHSRSEKSLDADYSRTNSNFARESSVVNADSWSSLNRGIKKKLNCAQGCRVLCNCDRFNDSLGNHYLLCIALFCTLCVVPSLVILVLILMARRVSKQEGGVGSKRYHTYTMWSLVIGTVSFFIYAIILIAGYVWLITSVHVPWATLEEVFDDEYKKVKAQEEAAE